MTLPELILTGRHSPESWDTQRLVVTYSTADVVFIPIAMYPVYRVPIVIMHKIRNSKDHKLNFQMGKVGEGERSTALFLKSQNGAIPSRY
jgi:hypothetical protein